MSKKTDRINEQIKQYETEKKYDGFVNVSANRKFFEPDDNFKYLKHNLFYTVLGAIVNALILIFIPIYLVLAFRIKYINKKMLKKVKGKGYVLIGNHTNILDVGISRTAVWHKKYYALSAPINNFAGFKGKLLNAIGSLPLTTKLGAMKNLDNAISTILKKGCALSIYPETGMWPQYKKIRPFSRGAFYYASKNNCPILPIITLYRNQNLFEKLFHLKNNITIKYLEPIFPKSNLSMRENSEYMKQKAQWEYNMEYQKFYNKTDFIVPTEDPDSLKQ